MRRVRAVRTARALPRPATSGAGRGRRGPCVRPPGAYAGGGRRPAGSRGGGFHPHHSSRLARLTDTASHSAEKTSPPAKTSRCDEATVKMTGLAGLFLTYGNEPEP